MSYKTPKKSISKIMKLKGVWESYGYMELKLAKISIFILLLKIRIDRSAVTIVTLKNKESVD